MDATITFEVPGPAVPQPRARATRMGRMYTPTKNGINVYKQAVSLVAGSVAKRAGWRWSDAPHEIDIVAIFPRPPSHLTKSGALRSGVPSYPGKRNGDNDNLEKGTWDAITACGSVWCDDSQIVANSFRKRYAAHGEVARTIITIRRPDT